MLQLLPTIHWQAIAPGYHLSVVWKKINSFSLHLSLDMLLFKYHSQYSIFLTMTMLKLAFLNPCPIWQCQMIYEEMWFTIRIRDIYTRSLGPVEPQISSPPAGIPRPARPRTSTCIYSGCIMHVSLMHIFMMQVQCTLSISNHAYIFWPPGCVHDACIYDANIHGLDLWPWYVCMMHIYQRCGKFRHRPTEIEFLG